MWVRSQKYPELVFASNLQLHFVAQFHEIAWRKTTQNHQSIWGFSRNEFISGNVRKMQNN